MVLFDAKSRIEMVRRKDAKTHLRVDTMHGKIDLTKHFCLQNSEELRAINAPLKLLGLDSFCFTSIDFNTEERFILTDHPDWTRYAYNSGFYNIDLVRKIETSGFLESFMWSDFSHDKKYNSALQVAKEFGLCHGITFIQHTADKLNMYYAGSSDNTLSEQHVADVSEQLLDFIPYFHYAAKNLIKESANHQFAVRKTARNDISKINPEVLKKFYDAIQVKQLVINDQGEHLTHQEALCTYLAISGKPAKIISEILGISIRTVEKHILNVRKKFSVKINETLLGKLFDSIYLNHIVYYGKRHLSGACK